MSQVQLYRPNFLPNEAFARLKPLPTADGLPEGYYLVDPNQQTTFQPGKTPHYEEILKLPAVATVNLNPLTLARYFPGFMEQTWHPVPQAAAVVSKK